MCASCLHSCKIVTVIVLYINFIVLYLIIMPSVIQNRDVIEALNVYGGDLILATSFLSGKWTLEEYPFFNKDHFKTKVRRLLEKKPKKSKDSDIYQGWLSTSFFEIPELQPLNASGDAASNPNGRPSKRLRDSPHKKTVDSLLEQTISDLTTYAEEQGVTVDHLLELIASRVSPKKTKVQTHVIIPEDEAVAFYFNEGYSSRSWTELRVFLSHFGVELPTRNTIDNKKKNLGPPILSQEIKCSVTYPDLIQDTVEGLVSAMNCKDIIPDRAVLELTAKTGIDGSGCHKARHQVINTDLSLDENPHLDPSVYSNYLLCCVAPLFLHLKTDSERLLLWKNPMPNSISYTRPLSLVRAAESRDVIEKEFESLFSSINNNDVFSINLDLKSVSVKVKNTVSMIDGKMVGIVQGDTGNSKCHYCTSSTNQINSIVFILQGFVINKDFDSCMAAWKQIEEGMNWNDEGRQGQCIRPLVAINFYAILHWKLRSFDFALNILYRLVAGVHVWGKAGQNDPLKAAKTNIQDNLRQKLGILVDVPTPGGGTTNSGPIAQRFFDPNSRETICELIPNIEDRQHYHVFLQNVNVMLSVCLGMKAGVNTDKLRQLGIDIMSHIRTSFLNTEGNPWVPVNPSLHAMCAHSWQLFEMADGEPIAMYSEQAQEHWNKNVASYKSGSGARARQHSVKLNIRDIMARMLHMTHPVVVAKQRRVKCSVCSDFGHTARSKLFHGQHQLTHEDDILINSLFD